MNATVPWHHKHKKTLKPFSHSPSGMDLQGHPSLRKIKRQQVGDLAQTTPATVWRPLHEYTVKEAIHDGAVLGFKVDYRNTLITDQSENDIPDTVYENEEHMLEVLDAIINKIPSTTRLPKRSRQYLQCHPDGQVYPSSPSLLWPSQKSQGWSDTGQGIWESQDGSSRLSKGDHHLLCHWKMKKSQEPTKTTWSRF